MTGRKYLFPVCRGSYALGTACGRCERCEDHKAAYQAQQVIDAALNTPSAALRELREVKAQRDRFEVLLDEACERIADMLRQDDGEAFFEAEKFLKRECPELYNEIGMPPEPLPDFPEPSFYDRVTGFFAWLLIGKPKP